MPAQQFIIAAPPGYEPVPARVLTEIDTLPCDLYIWRGPRPALYAMRGGDLRRVVARAQRGMAFLVREIDADLLRGALASSLPRVLSNQRISPIERSKTAYSIAAKVLAPIFMRDRPLDHDGLILTQNAIDAITLPLLEDEDLVWAMVATMRNHLATHAHAVNSAVYGIVLARFIRIGGPQEIRDVALGSLLHDIGKNRVPKAVLDKPGPLDESEWQVLRGHANAGHDMVVRALGYAPSYAHIIAEHHERCDGSGYPASRVGAQIALDSQLVAIVDAFDALTSRQPYRSAVSTFDALHLMRVAMRGQFNDELLREFIKLLGGWNALNSGGDFSDVDLRGVLKIAG
jgi:HD-GYP domain-containing protein (c-di-GMP phosphodiesterase class II)